MSPAPAHSKPRHEPPNAADRRSHRRYPLVLEVQYKAFRGRASRIGFGTTLNVSRRGVLFKAADSLTAGSAIELTMNWPFLLEGVCPLKLVKRGRVIRNDARGVAVRAKDHEFRIAGVAPSHIRRQGERQSA